MSVAKPLVGRILAPIAIATFCLSNPAAAQTYSGLYIFGDSLVDSGNLQQAALSTGFLPDPAPAEFGYFNGRFTDGYNFADLLSLSYLGVGPSTTFPYSYLTPWDPSLLTQPISSSLNFAYGGAQAIGGELAPTLTQQVDAYSAWSGRADPDALYLITISANDLLQMVPASGPSVPETLRASHLRSIADVIVGQVSRLFDLGANNVLLTGAPNIGLAPDYQGAPDEAGRRAAGTQFSSLLDNLLLGGIDQLTLHPDERLVFFSFNEFTDAVFANPGAYGFTNVKDACLAVRTPSPSIDCEGFAFFDAVHPTAQAHQLVANSIVSRLAVPAVPEPSTWAMMLLGFGFIGGAMRSATRRQKVTVSCA
jgi:outer membrane lipase/esterase